MIVEKSYFNKLIREIPLRRIGRIFEAALSGFLRHDCYAKSASLAFYTLLSIVPVLAVTIGIAKGFGLQSSLEAFIIDKFQENKVIANQILEFASNTLHHAEGSVIAGFGVLVLFWSVFSLLGSVETSLNDIWHVKTARTWGRKITHYLTLITLFPLLFAVGSSAVVFLIAQIRIATLAAIGETVMHPFMILVVNLFSLIMSWILFSCIYIFLPNTHVKLRYGMVAGIIAGTFYQIVQAIYIYLQIFLSSYGAIYGSLAAIPLFFIWLQVSWLIVLAGAELAFVIESDFVQYPDASDKSQAISKNLAALLIARKCVDALVDGKSPLSLDSIAKDLGISLENTLELTDFLVEGGVLAKTRTDTCYQGYQIALPLREITYKNVLYAIDQKSMELIQIRPSLYLDEIRETMQKIDEVNTSLDIPLVKFQY